MEILQIVLILLSVVYLFIAIGSLHRLCKVSTSQSAIKISIAFYSGMFIASAARATALYLISINTIPKTVDDKTFLRLFYYLMVVIPDMLNVCVYLFLIWYFFANFILSHINVANDLRLFMKDDNPEFGTKTYTLLYIIIPSYALTFGILCLLAFLGTINEDHLFLVNSYFNLITPFLFLGYFIYVLLKFSGRPYINEEMKMQVRRIFIIVVIWSLARLVTGILGIAINRSFFNSLIDDFEENSKDFLYSVIIAIYFFVSEYLPDLFALDYSFMLTLIVNNSSNSDEEILFDEETPPVSRLRHYSLTSHDMLQDSLVKPLKTPQFKHRSKSDFMIASNQFNLIENIYTRPNGLGNIYKGNYNSKEVTLRQLKFDRLSRYDLEGLSNDMEELINLDNPYICPVIGLSVESIPNVYIFWRYYKVGSLHDLLHVQKTELNSKAKLKIARHIAMGMEYLHQNSIYHFHLSSRNILMQDDMTPNICDYGFHYFKEISSIFLKYKNKNSYSSPELLSDNRSISNITGSNENFTKCDVYSFGILLWELYTGTVPFDVKLSTLYDLVVKDNYRPEITKDFNAEIANLIRSCWDIDPKQRPEFKNIVENLNKIIIN